MIAKAIVPSGGIELHALRHGARGDVGFAPNKHDHRVDDECQQKVDRHTANHHQQALPCRLRTELPRFGRLLKLLGIETFVHHAGNLAIATKRQPPDAILGVAMLGFESEQAACPLANAHVEEHVELVYLYAEKFCEEHVADFVQQH